MIAWDIIALGKAGTSPTAKLTDDYLRQASLLAKPFGLSEIKLKILGESRARSAAARQKEEAAAIEKSLGSARSIVLDERGSLMSSQEFAALLQKMIEARQPLGFVLGGPDGLSESIRSEASATLALGRLTMPHLLARAVLAEQIYRAFTILSHHPYHRD